MRKNDTGFTLTELLIVIVILGVLTGVVVVAVGAFTDRGETAACRADKKSVEVATEAYRAKFSAYPAGADSPARQDVLVAQQFLREKPNSPKYIITLNADGSVT